MVNFEWKKNFRFYLADLIATIVIVILCLAFTTLKPYDRFFVERDSSLSYPYIPANDNEVPLWLLAILALIIPFFIILVTQVSRFRVSHFQRYEKTPMTTHLFLPHLTLLESFVLTWLITSVLKVIVGRKRPNFFAFCNYKGYRDALESGNFTLYDSLTVAGRPGSLEDCLIQDSSVLHEAQFSFPSGHASITFAGLCIGLWFLLHAIPLNEDRKDFWHFRMWRALPMIFLIGVASIVACTRTRDYWHNFDDILVGAFIGTACAFFVVYMNSHLRISNGVDGSVSIPVSQEEVDEKDFQ